MDNGQTQKTLTIVIPVYNEGPAIRGHFEEIQAVLQKDDVHCSFLFVDDGSTDHTWKELAALSNEYNNVTAIRFARNFGKEIALAAGLDHTDSDLVLTMDSDLQHPPRYIRPMLDLMEREQADIVEGVKASRGVETHGHRFLAKSFYKVLQSVSGLEMDNSSDFKLMDRRVVDTLTSFHERNLFFRGIVGWVGFRTAQLPFNVDQRKGGNSHFPSGRLMLLAMNAILAFTSKPLYLTIFGGLIFLFFAVLLGVQTLYNYFSGYAVSGFSTVILLILILGSMIMMSLGIIGMYISRIYEEIKGRPRYIVSERVR